MMFKHLQFLGSTLRPLLFFCIILCNGASDAGPTGEKSDFGSEAAAKASDYRISITSATRWVNVNNGDTVQFEAGGKAFTWHFQTYKGASVFYLALIAPPGIKVGTVRVFVAKNVFELN